MKKTKELPSQEYLNEYFNYDKDTGILTRKKIRFNDYKNKVGDQVGSLDSSGYVTFKHRSRLLAAHRVAYKMVTGADIQEYEIDHINHLKDDNRFSNLRLVTSSENQRNKSMPSTNKSGTVGVCFDKHHNAWKAYIGTDDCRQKSIGLFKNKQDAIAARKAAETEYNYHSNHGK